MCPRIPGLENSTLTGKLKINLVYLNFRQARRIEYGKIKTLEVDNALQQGRKEYQDKLDLQKKEEDEKTAKKREKRNKKKKAKVNHKKIEKDSDENQDD